MFEATFSSLFHSVVKQNPEALCVQDSAGNRATRAEHFGRVRRLVGGFHTCLGLDKSSKFAVLARGEAGEITARTASLMSGYLNMPEATEAVCRDGRYHTGDIGYFDQEGYLYVVDRKNDMIVSGGENIYSLEVENAVASHPAVDQVGVIGVPDADWGEAVHAVVCLKPGASASSRAIIAHCRELLASYQCPKVVHIQAEALPVSGTNKVLKSVLREQYGH